MVAHEDEASKLTSLPDFPEGPGGPRGPIGPCYKYKYRLIISDSHLIAPKTIRKTSVLHNANTAFILSIT